METSLVGRRRTAVITLNLEITDISLGVADPNRVGRAIGDLVGDFCSEEVRNLIPPDSKVKIKPISITPPDWVLFEVHLVSPGRIVSAARVYHSAKTMGGGFYLLDREKIPLDLADVVTKMLDTEVERKPPANTPE